MKLITAIIQPQKLPAVIAALGQARVRKFTVCDALGYARQRGQTETFRGHEYKTDLLRKAVLEIVVNDDFLDAAMNQILQVARTGTEGTIGDGKIFVTDVCQVIDIKDGLRGVEAV